jgi:hypothetical protein
MATLCVCVGGRMGRVGKGGGRRLLAKSKWGPPCTFLYD